MSSHDDHPLLKLGVSQAELDEYLAYKASLSPAQMMAALRRQSVPEHLIQRELGADYRQPSQ